MNIRGASYFFLFFGLFLYASLLGEYERQGHQNSDDIYGECPKSITVKKQPLYICTAANSCYFDKLLNLIGSIHGTNFDELGEIAVFDIGMSVQEKDVLCRIKKVKLYDVELTHTDLLKPVIVGKSRKKKVPGWYAWKPVCLKQALDMFPYVLWIDAGAAILKSLDNFFEHLRQNGYFILNTLGHRNRGHITDYVKDKFNLNSKERAFILNASNIAAGFIGVTRKYYESFITPIYELTKDLRNFMDDGSVPRDCCPGGFGWARYEQTLFSIYVHLLGLKTNNQGYSYLSIDGKKVKFHIHEWMAHINNDSVVRLRNVVPTISYKQFIKYELD